MKDLINKNIHLKEKTLSSDQKKLSEKQFILTDRLIILLTAVAFIFITMQDVRGQNIVDIRQDYFNMKEQECKWMEVANRITDSANPVLLAYHGALLAASANCVDGALNKLKRFKQGREKLEKAVALNPDNTEIRFLRYSVKVKTPGILNYNDTEADKDFLITKLSSNARGLNEFLLHEICNFMLDHGSLDQTEKRIIQNIYR